MCHTRGQEPRRTKNSQQHVTYTWSLTRLLAVKRSVTQRQLKSVTIWRFWRHECPSVCDSCAMQYQVLWMYLPAIAWWLADFRSKSHRSAHRKHAVCQLRERAEVLFTEPINQWFPETIPPHYGNPSSHPAPISNPMFNRSLTNQSSMAQCKRLFNSVTQNNCVRTWPMQKNTRLMRKNIFTSESITMFWTQNLSVFWTKDPTRCTHHSPLPWSKQDSFRSTTSLRIPSLARSPIRVACSSHHFLSTVEYWFLDLVMWMLAPTTDSRSLVHSELFVLSRGLAMLDNRFRLQRTSHKHTLHLCKTTLRMCTPDLKVPDHQRTIGMFGNPDSCCPQFSWIIHEMVCWLLGLQSRKTISNQENLPYPHDMASIATNSWCRLSVLKRALTFVEFRCSVFRSRHSADCNSCSATTFILCASTNAGIKSNNRMLITRANGVCFTMTLGLVMNEEESLTNQITMLITLRCTLTQSALLRFRCVDTWGATRNYLKID